MEVSISEPSSGVVIALERTHVVVECRVSERIHRYPLSSIDSRNLVPGDLVQLAYEGDPATTPAHITDRCQRSSAYGRYDNRQKWRASVANLEVLAVVYASVPRPRAALLRYASLFAAAASQEVWLIGNKSDLEKSAEAEEIHAVWQASFARSFSVSCVTGAGMTELSEAMRNRRVALIGSTGVGKSSIVNMLYSDTRASVGELSNKRGTHTTSRNTLYAFGSGWVVDTPGFEAVDANDTDVETIALMFPDITEIARECRFRDCQHNTNNGCAVQAHVQSGALPLKRLEEFQTLLAQARKVRYTATNKMLSRLVFARSSSDGLI